MASFPTISTHERQLADLVAVYPVADALARRFAAAGRELYLVGGSVRDTLLYGTANQDLDFATSALPEETQRLMSGFVDDLWLTGARFGTVSGRKDDCQLEVTTFRSDEYSVGSRHPQVAFGDDVCTDLSRRDFTVNAMAVDLVERRFLDPFGGLADLNARRLRTPIDPEISFSDDPLRMVRMARFAALLDAEPVEAARKAATHMATQLDMISRERIRDELNKMLVAPHFSRGMDLLCDTGLAERFLPEVPALQMERDPLHHHKDVYAHTLAVVEGCRPDDLILRAAALLHDIGKPATREFHADGRVSFHLHEVVGARMARARLRELRYAKADIDAICDLVYLHLRFHGYSDHAWTDSAVRRYARDAGSPIQLQRLNELARADVTTQNRRKARRLAEAMDDLEERIARLQEQEALAELRPALNGNQIMEHLGIPPGPAVGEAWNMLLEARIERGPMTEAEAYELLDAWARQR